VSRITNRLFVSQLTGRHNRLVRGTATVEWEASPGGDVIVDVVVALVMQVRVVRLPSVLLVSPVATRGYWTTNTSSEKAMRSRRRPLHRKPSASLYLKDQFEKDVKTR
jgi:hypothetical protein